MKTKALWLTVSFICGMILLASGQTRTKSARTADPNAQLLGTWQGDYTGAASGKCELAFKKDSSGQTTGEIAFQPEGGEKTPAIPFHSVQLEGNVLKASFTDPDGDTIQMDGTLENNQLKGSWKTAANEGGTWQTSKAK